jgi:hypothetical protein
MDIFDKFFRKFAYKFDKGYPDMNNEKDIFLLNELLNNLGITIEEAALTPSELSKDATFGRGDKKPRIEILIDLIQRGEELELNDGSKFVVDNKEEVLSQLKGKTRITTAIKLTDKDGNAITTSNLKKTAEFGGGGGMRGGSDLTAKGESAQAIVNAIRYSLSGNISEEDITDETINDAKSDIRVTDFEGAKELLKDNPGWLTSSVSIANALASKYSGPFIQNRGSDWVQNFEKAVKPHLKKAGIGNINKWSPADIWMVSPDEMGISWPDTLDQINSLLLKKYNEGKIIGVSLKKAGKDASLKVFNASDSSTDTYKFEGIDVSPTHAKGFILFDGGKMEFRNETESIVFGTDDPKTVVIKKTFTKNDFKFENNILTIDSGFIASDLSDIEDTDLEPILVVRHDVTRTATNGLRPIVYNRDHAYKNGAITGNRMEISYDEAIS